MPHPAVTARCKRCANHQATTRKPPAIAVVGRWSNGQWVIQKLDRRTERSHTNQARAHKLPPGIYEDTPAASRFIRSWDEDFNARTGSIVCRVCNRRPPYGRQEWIRQAETAIKAGLREFYI